MDSNTPSHITMAYADNFDKIFYVDFTSIGRGEWLNDVSTTFDFFLNINDNGKVILNFSNEFNISSIEPIHLVTLACLIQSLYDKGFIVMMDKRNHEACDYLFQDLNFAEYWSGGKNHVEAKTSYNIFNLWRIVESEKDLYAKYVEQYFNNTDFKNKDLSALGVGLVEAFYNVFDHAQANSNAFLLLKYDEPSQRLHIAISDFGIGIPSSVKNYKPEIKSDIDAILWSIKDHSTVQSTHHNKGMGMGLILAIADTARIISGDGLLLQRSDLHRPYTINFKFPGTLIYLDVDMSSFDEVEILDSFNW